MKKIIVAVVAFIIGFFGGYFLLKNLPDNRLTQEILSPLGIKKREIIGFLPYWLKDRANSDYGKYITTLSYFSLTIDSDGTVKKLTNPQEEDPGWNALNSGAMDKFFRNAKSDGQTLSLTVFSGNESTIDQLLDNPVTNANNLMDAVTPLMKRYGFTDLNVDVESVIPASDSARENFTTFIKTVKSGLDAENLGTLTVDVSPIVLIEKYLINVKEISPFIDNLVLMTYDFHYPGSSVTGPVGQNRGGGVEAEYDSETAVKEALKIIPASKIILGIPLYGYQWETLGDTPRSAIIPGTGFVASAGRVEELLKNCASCSASLDSFGEEPYVIYKNQDTGTYTQIFYADKNSVSAKIKLATQYHLGGAALWALGYEGSDTLSPLSTYKVSSF